MAIQSKNGKGTKETQPKKQAPSLVAVRLACSCAGIAPLRALHAAQHLHPYVHMQAKDQTATGTRRASNLPVPVALGAAVLLGVLSLVKTKRPIYYTVEEGDNLCTIGECFNQDYRMMYDRNKQVITDPHVIYPGDRIRIA